MFWPFKKSGGEAKNPHWDKWHPQVPATGDLARRVRERLNREYMDACNQSELDEVLSRTSLTICAEKQPSQGLAALWQNRCFQVGFVLVCMAGGVLLAEWRLATYWRTHSEHLADRYVKLLTPDLSVAEEASAVGQTAGTDKATNQEVQP